MGELELVAIERPFHSMNAVDRTNAKLRTCAIDCRAFDGLRADSIFDADVKGGSRLATMAGGGLNQSMSMIIQSGKYVVTNFEK